MAFKNRIRLPFYLTRPQFTRESNVFRRADGSTKVQSVIIRMVFEGETDNLPKEIHERLIIALSHDSVTIEGKYLTTGIALDGDYEIDWNKFLDYPLAKGGFKVQVTPFNYSNDNCKTCEDLIQVVCIDDNIGTVTENETVTIHVLANDSICCKPVAISLVTYNTNYLDSCIISGDDLIIHTKATLSDASGIVLATYRAQCPNGAYDEANIIADISGSSPAACLTPTGVNTTDITDTTVTFGWDAMAGAISYHWQVYLLSDLINPIQQGDVVTNSVTISGLTPDTQYRFFIKTVCSGGESNYVYFDFITEASSSNVNCGRYSLFNRSFDTTESVTYLTCDLQSAVVSIPPLEQREVCSLQNPEGAPIGMFIAPDVFLTYLGLC